MKWLFFLLIFTCSFSVFGQKKKQKLTPKTKEIGLIISPEIRFTEHSDQHVQFAGGLYFRLPLAPQWCVESSVLFSKNDYSDEMGGLIFGTDILNGTTASYKLELIEKSLEWNQQLLYFFNISKRLQPFVGIGYLLQTPRALEGERRIEHSDGSVEILEEATLSKSKINPGLLLAVGADFALNNWLSFSAKTGWKNYFESNLSTYEFPETTVKEPNLGYSELFIQIGAGVTF